MLLLPVEKTRLGLRGVTLEFVLAIRGQIMGMILPIALNHRWARCVGLLGRGMK